MIRLTILTTVILLMAGCSTRGLPGGAQQVNESGPAIGVDESRKTPTMRSYTVNGKRYYPTYVHKGDSFDGIASWYGPNFHGNKTSSGDAYDMNKATAAHKTLPMNTIVKVTNKNNGRSTVVRINDRGPFVASRIIDLSKKAAEAIDMTQTGTAPVHLEVLGFADKEDTSIPTKKSLEKGPAEQEIGAFYVQIGSFHYFKGALFTQEKYDGYKNYHTMIKDTVYKDQRLFRVWMGPFQSEEEARDFVKIAPAENAFIVRN